MHKRKNPSKTKYSMFLILPDEIKHGAVCRAVLKSSLQLYPSLIQLNKNLKNRMFCIRITTYSFYITGFSHKNVEKLNKKLYNIEQ